MRKWELERANNQLWMRLAEAEETRAKYATFAMTEVSITVQARMQRDNARNIAAKLEAECATNTALLARVLTIIDAPEIRLGDLDNLRSDVAKALAVSGG